MHNIFFQSIVSFKTENAVLKENSQINKNLKNRKLGPDYRKLRNLVH